MPHQALSDSYLHILDINSQIAAQIKEADDVSPTT